ncbi:Glutathione S-transferase [Macrophomina phaseolina MS6]|uniref:glutathione transferase n=1 Tax=Macrophomina phaseolina (strain MS6) TaxID=1126212 RepID=K2SCD4_MACPH|nr:Glutathione S-transferase [Macrophomina phaseolina MS6]
MLAEELQFPHLLSVIDTTSQWFYRIHPERMVPSLKDQDPETKEEVIVFEGTACLQYLADRFDTDGAWTGRTAYEKSQVLSWTAYQTAGLGGISWTSVSHFPGRNTSPLKIAPLLPICPIFHSQCHGCSLS